MKSWLPVLVVPTLMILGCNRKPAQPTAASGKAAAVGGPGTYLKKIGLTNGLPGMNLCRRSDIGLEVYAPAGFEWRGARNYLAALAEADPNVTGAQIGEDEIAVSLFDARPDNNRPELYPSTLRIARYEPNLSIEAAKAELNKPTQTAWRVLPPLKTVMGEVPVWEAEINDKGFFGTEVIVIRRRYYFAWEGSSFLAFATRLKRLPSVGLDMERALTTFRLGSFNAQDQAILPPVSPKSTKFGTAGEQQSEEYFRRKEAERQQQQIDDINRINEMNRRRQEMQGQNGGGQVPPPPGP
ncbi:MAG: hypothetical protein JST35_07325 [Armatimonadetes bacterium]|nr:hypothetical protein [Armatimonadota bacterium]